MKVGFLHSIIRQEEKLLIQELRKRSDIELQLLDDRNMEFNLADDGFELDVVLHRSINQSRSINAITLFESFGVKCVNSSQTATICGDKLHTSATLKRAGIPQPEVRIAFSEKAALHAMQDMGFPVVLKPAVGSWGRLLSKINDEETAVTILQHKKVLGSYQHAIYYIQAYIEKMGRDIRVIVVGDEVVAASYRTSEHWITNASRGGVSIECPITDEIREISLNAAKAVGGGLIGIDLFESPDGFLVNEINDTMEFKGCMAATGKPIPAAIIDYVINQLENSTEQKADLAI